MSGPKVPWPPEDDAELRKAYAIADHLQASAAMHRLAKRKGVVIERLHSRARTLGIGRVCRAHRDWTQAEIENLEQYAGPDIPPSAFAGAIILGASEHRGEKENGGGMRILRLSLGWLAAVGLLLLGGWIICGTFLARSVARPLTAFFGVWIGLLVVCLAPAAARAIWPDRGSR